jgi:Pyridoxamine 5'-phosphate oxidase
MDASDIYKAKAAPEAIRQHLERPITAVVGTLNADGSIHLAFVLFLWMDGRLYFETASTTRKARNVAARGTASFAIDGKGFMAMAEGHGRIIDGDEAHEINRALRRKYLTEAAVTTVGEAWGTVDDIAVEITPETWRSWSNEPLTQLGVEAAGDLPRSEWWNTE